MGNGETERMNRTICNILKTLNETEKTRQKDHFLKFVFAQNSTISKSTGYSPFFLMFERSLKLPIDSIFDVQNNSNNEKSFLAEWKESMQ